MVVDDAGVPPGNLVDSASPAEIKLVEATRETMVVPRHGRGRPRKRPERRISDQAWDVVRWERYITMYRAFFHMACLLITLKKL